ncbi:MAG: hypothetical protein R3Y60_04320 [bacterium]
MKATLIEDFFKNIPYYNFVFSNPIVGKILLNYLYDNQFDGNLEYFKLNDIIILGERRVQMVIKFEDEEEISAIIKLVPLH